MRRTGRKGSKWKVIIAVVGFLLMILGMLVIMATWSDRWEEDPVFTGGVVDEIDIQKGDFKLEKQPNIGDPSAPVKVMQFVDYKCPYCKAWNINNFNKFKEDYIESGKVQLYVINFPFIGPDSFRAAMVGEILWNQSPEAFWEFQEAIYNPSSTVNRQF